MGADTWDGTAAQVRARWRLGKGVTMPFLLNASQMAIAYGQTYQTFVIINHEGFIHFKTNYLIPMNDLRDEVLLALADLPPIEEEPEEAVEMEETEETAETGEMEETSEAEETIEAVEVGEAGEMEETAETGETPNSFDNLFDLFDEEEEAEETAVETAAQASVPQAFSLAQNAPNPFNSNTIIRFALPQPRQVELAIYNLRGQPVATLVQGAFAAGAFSVRWDGRDQAGQAAASGVYLYRLRAGEDAKVRKLLLLR